MSPYRMWVLDALFGKDGVPVMGTRGVSMGRVVVFKAEEFKRLLGEVPALAAVAFDVGEYVEEER